MADMAHISGLVAAEVSQLVLLLLLMSSYLLVALYAFELCHMAYVVCMVFVVLPALKICS